MMLSRKTSARSRRKTNFIDEDILNLPCYSAFQSRINSNDEVMEKDLVIDEDMNGMVCDMKWYSEQFRIEKLNVPDLSKKTRRLQSIRWLYHTKLILLFSIFISLIQPSAAIVEMRCGPVDIRNKPSNFNNLPINLGDNESLTISKKMNSSKQVNCTVIEGSFVMAFIKAGEGKENFVQTDYPRFPNLLEITGSLLVFEVQGLKSLSWMFPNLRVIGGQVLIQHYSLIVYKNDDLENLGLKHLRVIRNGGVRITDNKRLCHTKTIDWKGMIISKVNDVVLDDAAQLSVTETGILCPTGDCEKDPNQKKCRYIEEGLVQSCWNSTTCQKACEWDRIGDQPGPGCDPHGNKCDDECTGGCMVANDPRACNACKNFHYQGRCIPKCADNLYVLMNRRCVTKEKCLSLNPEKRKVKLFIKATNGLCSDRCPDGYEENPDDPRECKKCDSQCQITCIGNYTIETLSKALEIKRCHIIDGSLTIEVKGGMDSGVASEIGEAFANIHTIRGALTIYRSPTFVNLFMFKNLKKIQGKYLYLDKYALSIVENSNLKKLFDPAVHFEIERGFLQFHNNRMLCFRQIIQLMEKLGREPEMSENDQSSSSNGDKAICDDSTLEVEAIEATADTILLQWTTFNTSNTDHRKFLGYEVYYKEVDKIDYNMSIDDDRSACSDTWNSVFVDRTNDHDSSPFQIASLESAQRIKPNRIYAFYVTTQMVHHIGARNAVSKIGFVKTLFATPDPPIVSVQKVSTSEIELHWEPPVRPNGVITHYVVSWREIDVDIDLVAQQFCSIDQNSHHNRYEYNLLDEVDEKTTTTVAPSLVSIIGEKGEPGTCSAMAGCCECPKVISVEQTEDEAEFENNLHDVVFVQNCDFDFDPVRCAPWQPEMEDVPEEEMRKLTKRDSRSRRRSEAWENRRKEMYRTLHTIRNTYKDYESYTALIMRVRRSIKPAKDEEEEKKVHKSNVIIVSKKNTTEEAANTNLTDVTMKEPLKTEAGNLMTKNVTAKPNVNAFTIINLKHYTQYSITVAACQDVKVAGSKCSVGSKAAKMKRTKALPEMDRVLNDTIQIDYLNSTSTVRITWKAPENPNGGIQGYYVKLISLAGAAPHQYCQPAVDGNWTSFKDGVVFKGLADGEYRVEVIAVSMYKAVSEGTFGNEIVVIRIPGFWTIDRIIIAGAIFLLFMGLVGGIAYFFIRRYYGRKVKHIADMMSSNPEYVIDQVYKQDEWELKRDDLELMEEIGMGTFGKVFKGFGKDCVSKKGEHFGECAIKTVQDSTSATERLHFLLEASVMKAFEAPFIVKLFGVVSCDHPVLCVMELMKKGNLRDYLRARRPDSEDNVDNLPLPTPEQYHEWASQIADGMAYLESLKFCHRDLAARNCMVGADETVKIGDFGMARDLYYHDYYKPTGKRLMPVRWMAPESLKDGKFDSKSDCWSYGVVLYEMLTLGQQPYQGLSNDEVLNFIGMSRRVLEIPHDCPPFWYKIMNMCWRYSPKNRPTFAQLVTILAPLASDNFRSISYVLNHDMTMEYDDEQEDDGGEHETECDYVEETQSQRGRLDSIALKEFRPCSSHSGASSRSSLMQSRDSRKSSIRSMVHPTMPKFHTDHRQHSLDRINSLANSNSNGTIRSRPSARVVENSVGDGDYVEKDVRQQQHQSLLDPQPAAQLENDEGYCMSNRNGALDFPSWGEGDRLRNDEAGPSTSGTSR